MCCFPFQEKRPLQGTIGLIDWRLHGHLSRLQMSDFFVGRQNESLLFLPGRRLPVDYLLLIGAGSRMESTAEKYESLLEQMIHQAAKLNCANIVLALPGRPENIISADDAIQRFFLLCPAFSQKSISYSFSIIDTFEMQPIITSESEKYRMKASVAPLIH